MAGELGPIFGESSPVFGEFGPIPGGLMLALGATEPRLGYVLVLTAIVLAVAWFGRKRLPAGVGPALFVVGLSAVLAAGNLSGGASVSLAVRYGLLCTALAVLWHLAVRWAERGSEGRFGRPGGAVSDATTGGSKTAVFTRISAERRIVGEHVVVLCGLVAVGMAFGLPASAPSSERWAATLCLLVLLAISLRRYLDRDRRAGGQGLNLSVTDGSATERSMTDRRSVPQPAALDDLSGYAVGALACGAVYLWEPVTWLAGNATQTRSAWAGVALLLASAICVCGALVPVWRHWRHRRRVWRTEPELLLAEPAAKWRAWLTGVIVFSTVVGVRGLFLAGEWLVPFATVLAAIAAFTVDHRWQGSGPAGKVGLILLGESVVLAAIGWLPRSNLNPLLGGALAAVYLLWLARFWQQQLRDGVAWTASGRLVPLARSLGHAVAFGCGALAVSAAWAAAPGAGSAGWIAALATLALLILASMLVRDAQGLGGPAAAFAACVVVLAAVVPAGALLGGLGLPVAGPVLAGGASVLLVLRVGPARGEPVWETAYNAYVGAIMPALAMYAGAVRGIFTPGSVAPIVAAACVGLAIVLRWRGAVEGGGVVGVQRQPRT
jgi:hypothetical protein